MTITNILKVAFIAGAVVIATLIGKAEPIASDVIFTTQYSDGRTNTWTQADLVQALGLLNRKYHRDCEKVGGRRAWHGKLKKEIVNTNELTKTEVYEDGTSFTYKFKVKTPAQAVKDYNSRLSTNGVPARIAAARLKRMQEKATTNTVDVTLVAGESK